MKLFLFFWLVATTSQQQRLFEWTELPFSKEVFAQRRDRVIERLRASGGGVFLVPSRYGVSDGFTFRQLDDFLYFTGLELPDSMLVIDADERKTTLFVPPRDARYENPARSNDFPGRLLGADPELGQVSGIADVRPFEELADNVEAWVDAGRRLRVNVGRRGAVPSVETQFIKNWSPAETLILHLETSYPDAELGNAFEDVARLRMVHGAEEIEAMRRVCDLTMTAIRHAARFVRDGVDERTLEAELEADFKRGGSQRLAFASIIKSGENSIWPWRILAANYDRRNRTMHDGELVIFDVGTELDYFVSDVGRTLPVSGKFTDAQKQKLEMITAVSDAMIATIRPGTTLAAVRDAGIAKIPPNERQYMQVGSFYGHHIGLSTGDPALMDAPLATGMIFTVEPWYYNHDDEISVFVEDVVLVTVDGAENLTEALPRRIDGLENLMR